MNKSFIICCLCLVLYGCQNEAVKKAGNKPEPSHKESSLILSSDNKQLVQGFNWANKQAQEYVFEGDPVGKWFEASLPGRAAFCMRDVSHQAYGAMALGLNDHLKNMLHKFSINISASKDWCSYWEINKDDKPAPVDYKNDEDFWYNLPANFDVIETCYRAYQWTGDTSYINQADFINFYKKSLNEYVLAWDIDQDGLMESPENNGTRGLATYWEAGGPHAETGADLVASQFAGYKAFAKILLQKGETSEATKYFAKADRLYKMFNDKWWYKEKDRFYSSQLAHEVFDTSDIRAMQIFSLYWDIVDISRKPSLFSNLGEGMNVEENSYLAEVYYKNGMIEKGFESLMKQLDPELKRREYPENSFTAIGTIVNQVIGLKSYATENAILTRSGLPPSVKWVQVRNIPVQDCKLDILQVGQSETEIQMTEGSSLLWYSRFPGEYDYLLVNGKRRNVKKKTDDRGNSESQLTIQLEKGQTYRIKIPLGKR